MRKVIRVGLLPVMITLCSTLSFAEYNITSGISIMGEYNDNIFLDSDNEEDDFITTVSPNIAFNYSTGKMLDLTLYYGLNFRFYNRHNQLNDENIDEIQDIYAVAHIRPSHIFFIDISDTFDRVPIDIRRRSSIYNYNENTTNVNEFTASPYMILPLTDSISATIGYAYANTWYNDTSSVDSDTSSVDSDTHTAFLTLDKRFTPRLNGAVEYEYYAYRPDLNGEGSNDEVEGYDRHKASAEIYYRIIPSITIYVELGEVWFDDQAIDDTEDFFWNVGTQSDKIFKISENTSFGFNYGIEYGDSSGADISDSTTSGVDISDSTTSGAYISDSTTSGAYRSQQLNLYLETGNILKFEVNPYYRDTKYLTSDRKDRSVGVDVALSRPITRKLKISIDANVEEIDYVSEDEDALRYSVGSDLEYSLNRRMNISMGYRYNYQNASSDISNEELEINDYKNNIGWLQAGLIF